MCNYYYPRNTNLPLEQEAIIFNLRADDANLTQPLLLWNILDYQSPYVFTIYLSDLDRASPPLQFYTYDTWFQFSNLAPSTRYEVRVTARITYENNPRDSITNRFITRQF